MVDDKLNVSGELFALCYTSLERSYSVFSCVFGPNSFWSSHFSKNLFCSCESWFHEEFCKFKKKFCTHSDEKCCIDRHCNECLYYCHPDTVRGAGGTTTQTICIGCQTNYFKHLFTVVFCVCRGPKWVCTTSIDILYDSVSVSLSFLSNRSGHMSGCMSIAREWNSTSSSLHMRFFSKTRSAPNSAYALSLCVMTIYCPKLLQCNIIARIASKTKKKINVCSVISGQRQLGLHWRGWSASTKERRLAPVQDHDGVQVQSQAFDHRNPSAELFERAVVPAALHYAREVGHIYDTYWGIKFCTCCM